MMGVTVIVTNLQEAMADAAELVELAVEGVDYTELSISYSALCTVACPGGCQFVFPDGERKGERCGVSCRCDGGMLRCVDGHLLPIPEDPNLSTELLLAGGDSVVTSEEKFRKLAEFIEQMTAAALGSAP